MGAKNSTPQYECVDGEWFDKKTGLLRRHYYDAHGMIRAQLVERKYDGALEFSLVDRHTTERLASKEPLFPTGESVFVMPTLWVAQWAAFATQGDMQPGPIPMNEVL